MGEGGAWQKEAGVSRLYPGTSVLAVCPTGLSSMVYSDKLVLGPCDPKDVTCAGWGKDRCLSRRTSMEPSNIL